MKWDSSGEIYLAGKCKKKARSVIPLRVVKIKYD